MDPVTVSIVSVCLTGVMVVSSLLAVFLTHKGKEEDQRLASRQQSFDELNSENERLRVERDRLIEENRTQRMDWEGRLDRQLGRCRKVTDSLSHALAVKIGTGLPSPEEADAFRALIEHNEDDHHGK